MRRDKSEDTLLYKYKIREYKAMRTVYGMVIICMMLVVMPASASDLLEVFGNANMDNTIDEKDVAYVEGVIKGKNAATNLSDANYDGKIDETDIAQIKQIIQGDEKKLTFIDCDREIVTVNKPIDKIVIAHWSQGEAIRALGCSNKVVGVCDNFKDHLIFLPEMYSKPCVGSRFDLDIEAILNLEPNAIILGSREWHTPTLEGNLNGTGIGVVRVNFEPFTCGIEMMKLAYILDEEDMGREYYEWQRKYIEMIQKKVSEISDDEKPAVFIDAMQLNKSKPGTTTYGAETAPNSAIEVVGGKNIAHDILAGSIVEIDTEAILERNPDLIIGRSYEGGYEPDNLALYRSYYDALLGVPGFDHLNAVEENRVYIFSHYLIWSLQYPVGCIYFGKWLHPDLFEDLDPQKVQQEFIDKFCPGLDFDVQKQGLWVYHPEEHPNGR